MADDADTASEQQDRMNAEALEQRTRYSGHSAEFCMDCGDPIPDERREAIPGVNTCCDCAAVRERRL